MNNSDSDVNSENDDLDQIPEAAATVITKWFKDHQGVCKHGSHMDWKK